MSIVDHLARRALALHDDSGITALLWVSLTAFEVVRSTEASDNDRHEALLVSDICRDAYNQAVVVRKQEREE